MLSKLVTALHLLVAKLSRAPLTWRVFRDRKLLVLYVHFILRVFKFPLLAIGSFLTPSRRRPILVRSYVIAANRCRSREDLSTEKVYEGTELRPTPPVSVTPVPSTFSWAELPAVQPTYIARAINGRAVGSAPYVFTSDGTLLTDLSRAYSRRAFLHYAYLAAYPSAPEYWVRRAAVIGLSGAENIFHFMFDQMPRIFTLLDAGYAPAEFDLVLLHAPRASFQKEMMQLLGWCGDNMSSVNSQTHVGAKELIVPSFQQRYVVPPRVVRQLRSSLLPRVQALSPVDGSRIHISRSGSGFRRVRNESALRKVMREHGFRSVKLERMLLSEQIALFRDADVVVGDHGAGLSHIAFCNPGTTIIELGSPYWTNPCFWALAHVAGCRYALVTNARVNRQANSEISDSFRDYFVDIPELKEVFRVLGLS